MASNVLEHKSSNHTTYQLYKYVVLRFDRKTGFGKKHTLRETVQLS